LSNTYANPEFKTIRNLDLAEKIGPVQTGYAQIIWQQTEKIETHFVYNHQLTNYKLSDDRIVKLEKKVRFS
jgi:hypothetical protein